MATTFSFMFIIFSSGISFLVGLALSWAVLGKKNESLLTRARISEDEREKLSLKNDSMQAQVQDLLQKNAKLEQLEEKFALQFENLANKIFDEKNDRFKKESQESIASLLNPLRERMQEFQKKVDDSFGAQVKEQISLKKEIENIISVNEKMTQQTESLTRALKGDVKAQGNWGEVILEKILEDSGLKKGVNYTLQGEDMRLKHADDDTRRLQPDVIVHLPEDKHIVIDAKVSLNAYERYSATEDAAEKNLHLKSFLTSVRARVNELAERRYQDAKLTTPDFVLMFMPIEGAYSLAVQKDPELHGYAWNKKIVIVCPTTLFATLKTIDSVWRLELQNRHAEEIARQGGALYDKVVGFVEDMQGLGSRLSATQKTFDAALNKLSDGTGSILSRTQKLKTMGVKTGKALPKELIDDASLEEPFKKVENA
jgi:DNA recombination protein RmuC